MKVKVKISEKAKMPEMKKTKSDDKKASEGKGMKFVGGFKETGFKKSGKK